MAKVSNKEKVPGNGRKITILNREEVQRIFDLCALAHQLGEMTSFSYNYLKSVLSSKSENFIQDIWDKLPNSMKTDEEENRCVQLRLKEEAKNELKSSWPKKELTRFNALGVCPIGEYAPFICDTATLLKQRVDKSGIYFQEYDGVTEKDIAELDTGLDFVLEVGSFGLAYNDENFYDARGYDLSILPIDIVGEVSNETLSYWKKRFDVPVRQTSYGEEFNFSPASLGTMVQTPKNVLRVNKWFHNGESIFNVLMVFYSLSKNERVYTVSADDNVDEYENCEVVEIEVPYVDVQLNVFADGMDKKNTIKKLKAKIDNPNCFTFSTMEVVDKKGKNKNCDGQLSLTDAYLGQNVLSDIIDRIFAEEELTLIRKDFGHGYRPKDSDFLLKVNGKVVHELDENGNKLKAAGDKIIGVPKDTYGLTREVLEVNGNIVVVYKNDDGKIIYKNGKPVKKAS